MAIFEENKVTSAGSLKQIKLQDLEKGPGIYFYVARTDTRNSQEFGDFTIVEGLELYSEGKTADEMVEKSVGASFIANTMIQNMLNTSSVVAGKAYRIEKTWNKGDEFKGKKAKGYGYTFYELKVPNDVIVKMRDKFLDEKASPDEEL